MQKLLFFGIVFFLPVFLHGQNQTLTGKVLDKSTEKALENVQLFIPEQHTGSSTDKDGTYRLSVSGLNDSAVITHLGYKPKVIGLKQLKAENTVFLEVQPITLPPYIIPEPDPESIIRLAYHNMHQNYDTAVCRYEANVSYKRYRNGILYFDGDYVFDILTRYGYPALMQYYSNLRMHLIKGTERVKTKAYEKIKGKRATEKDSAGMLIPVDNILTPFINHNTSIHLQSFLRPSHQKKYRYKFIHGLSDHYFYISFSSKHSESKNYNERGTIVINKQNFAIVKLSYTKIFRFLLSNLGEYRYEINYIQKGNKYYPEEATLVMNSENATFMPRISKNHLLNIQLDILSVVHDNAKIINPADCLNGIDFFESLSEKYKEKFNP